ncbi:MAG: hypothetical protein PHN38_05225 [Sulfurospirillaceae bacterium]|nr:hypothetical protein [Sulfurospirillaceae bacterium]MDD3463203.1 hypothetical protein [Sulfurospirillaceae bacterium]
MSVELEKLSYFKNFIENEKNELGYNIYVMVLVVEAYYEFISEVLIPSSSRSMTQFKLLEELRALKLVNEQEFTIMNETRKLKNELTHRLDYMVDVTYLHDFNNNCKLANKKIPEDKYDQKAIDESLRDALLKSYKIVDEKLYKRVEEEIQSNEAQKAYM